MHRVLEGILKSRRLAAAYIFVGPPGSAKLSEAQEFSRQLGSAGTDLICLRPDGASLKIEQVIELQQMVRYGPAASPYLVAIVDEADKLTEPAAAAFLKTLEEPPPKVIFVLMVERQERLPATIQSRCQRIIFGESETSWEPRQEWEGFYRELAGLKKSGAGAALIFSAQLEKERGRLEELIYDLAFYAWYRLRDLRAVRELLTAARNIKKKMNIKLTLDCACLRLAQND